VTKTIQPNFIQGTLQIPASKSYMQRACAAALLKGGTTNIYNFGISNDDKAALDVIQQLGAIITYEKDFIKIESNNFGNVKNNSQLQLGESGLGLRMFTPIAALLNNEIIINGHGSLTKRPMHFFDDILPQLNVAFASQNGFLPFKVKGALQAKNITVDVSLSSQFLTGLLMAYSYANENAIITVQNLTSKPYIDITLEVLKSYGLNTPTHNNYEAFHFTKKDIATNENLTYPVESDWSSASFILVAAAINGSVISTGLNVQSVQADKKILEALQAAKVNMSITYESITIQKSTIQPFYFDATECPDLFPPLVALASYANGTTVIKGANRLTHKESNRALTLQEEFGKLGVQITLQDDDMVIKSTGTLRVINNKCNSHNDHRIAMALAIAALGLDEAIHIENAEAISKSYPNFFEDVETLVGTLENRQTN
jgi:3-phosphoshikimate 1-carboxyvinyltransferase